MYTTSWQFATKEQAGPHASCQLSQCMYVLRATVSICWVYIPQELEKKVVETGERKRCSSRTLQRMGHQKGNVA